jgi:HSP20 family protein
MSSLTRYEPFRELETFARRFNDMFTNSDLFSHLPMFGENGTFSPKVDISEDEQNIFIHAELPGLEKQDVKVTISDNSVLTIKGEKKKEDRQEDKSKNYLRVERSYGSFVRSFTLPENINADAIEGLLNVKLPKVAPKKTAEKEIAVK